MSTGDGSLKEIKTSVSFLKKYGAKNILLKCTSSYQLITLKWIWRLKGIKKNI